jgi:sigma-B regulation protein RsbU (phosphoserine phosphatase)
MTRDQSEDRSAEIGRYKRLIESAKMVNSTLDLGKLLNIIAETAVGNVGADRGTLYLIDDARQELWSKVLNDPILDEIHLPLGKGIAGYVAVTGDVVNIRDAYSDSRFNPEFDLKSGYRTKTILCMPLRKKDGRIVGVFQLLNKLTGAFTAEDVHFIDALSIHAAIAIENARLHAQEKKKIALDEEIKAARTVQMALIPRSIPETDSFGIAAGTFPAKEVGGDYYDFIRIDEHRHEIVIADVSGKGLSAAMLAAMGKGVFYSQAIRNVSPTVQLKESNRILRHLFPHNMFITMLIASVDSTRRSITLANAGHCLPVLYRTRTGRAELVPVRGMALNLADRIHCEERVVVMEPGDCIVLYSDGVTEARTNDESFFELERLQPLVERMGSLTPRILLDSIVDELRVFSGGAEQADDITIIVIKAAD